MGSVRKAGLLLEADGKIWVMQKGQRVQGQTAKAPIRYRIAPD